MRLIVLLALVALSFSGCRRNPEESAVSQPAPPPAAALAAQSRSLDASLELLQAELSAALESDLSEARLLRAEAITDRLLETQMPFTWLTAQSYSLEAKIRQVQALADRIIAQLRSGMQRERIRVDVEDLQRRVVQLRKALAQGGGQPPASLDSLLAAYARDSVVVTDVGE